MNRFFIGLLIGIVVLASLSGLAQALPDAPGDLDTSFAGFGTGGKVITTGLPPSIYNAPAMTLQPDGKIVAAGVSGSNPLVTRYLPDGSLDVTFSGDGKAIITTIYPSGAYDVAIQTDGKIVVAGWSDPGTSDFLLARLTSNGELDPSFGNGGLIVTDFDNASDIAKAILIQPDGKIVAAGWVTFGGDDDFGVARYNPDGTIDATFGGSGRVAIGFGDQEYCNDIALLSDGDLLLIGDKWPDGPIGDADFAIARLNADGSLDTAYDSDGKLTTGFGGDDEASAVAIQQDGKILVAGSNFDNVRVARYLPNGELDVSFDGDGKRSIDSLSGDIESMALQPDGKIILLGFHQSPDDDRKFAFYRLNPDASLDPTFDNDGFAFIDFGGDDRGYDIHLQADGRILASGRSNNNPALLRLWPDGSLDAGGQQTLGFDDPFFGSNSQESAYGLARQPDGKLILVGDIADEGGSDRNFALARFLPDGLLDTSFGSQGRVSFGFGAQEGARAVAIQPDGKIVAAGTTGLDSNADFMVARFNPDGSPDDSFGFLGYTVIDIVGGDDYGLAVALAPDGKIVMAGTSLSGTVRSSDISVARFNSDGSLDTGFDLDGKHHYQIAGGAANSANAVVVLPDLKIILAGNARGDFGLLRLNADGSIDDSFGDVGRVVTDLGGNDSITGLVRQSDGSLIAAGGSLVGANSDFALARYTASGLLDTAFGVGGKATVDFGGVDTAYAVDLRSDGTIVAAGCFGELFALAQLLPNGVLDPGFNSTGKTTTDFVGSDECASAVKYGAQGKIIAAGFQTVFGNTNMAVARFETTSTTAPTSTPDPSPTPGPGGIHLLYMPLTTR